MKKMKKLFAVLLAFTMVMGISLTTFAATPVERDSAKVTVKNVEVGSTLKAYQIIDATYTTQGFVSYVWAQGTPNAGQKVAFDDEGNVVGLTSDMITALAGQTSALADPEEVVTDSTPEEMELEVGAWLILVTPKTNADKIYNPMVASVYYDVDKSGDDTTAEGTIVDANVNWDLATKDAYAKSSTLTIEKTVDDKEFEVDDVANFTVTSTIPSYSAEYTKVTYKITDEIVNGLAYTETAPVVKVNNVPLTEGTEYTLSYNEGKTSFTIDFAQSYVLGLAGKTAAERAVVVTYSATVTEEAIEKVAENKATLTYTHKPGEETTTKVDDEKVYTFEFDGVLKKVDADGNALENATFTLYRGSVAEANIVATDVTDKNGNIYFSGLDSDETYYLKETVAPDGYSLNETVYKITINPSYDNQGLLTGYTVTVDDEDNVADAVTTGTITYGGTPAENIGTVVNTHLSALPATGGIGTAVFTIGGCAIMIAAAYFFFVSRKKEA